MIRVFLVDDHEMARDGIRSMLSAHGDIEVVGEADCGETAIGRIVVALPDVALLDINLPGISGIEVCRDLRDRCPAVASVMLTSFAEDEALFDSILAGAAGYVMKHVRGNQLAECIRRAAVGESLIDRAAAEHLRARVLHEHHADPMFANLTVQERRVLELLAAGLTNRAIAEELYLSDKTVKNYVSSLLTKLGMARRSEAAAYAARLEARRAAYAEALGDTLPVRF